MIHESLSSLIALVRKLVGDAILPAVTPSAPDPCADVNSISDAQIQRAIEATREMVRYERLIPIKSVLPGGAVEYKHWQAEGHLGNGYQIVDASYTPLETVILGAGNTYISGEVEEADVILGEFVTHSSFPTGLLLVGNRYDPYRAAADLLEQQAAAVKRDVDFSEQGLSIKQSQAADRIMALAREYRRQQRIGSIGFGRSDIR